MRIAFKFVLNIAFESTALFLSSKLSFAFGANSLFGTLSIQSFNKCPYLPRKELGGVIGRKRRGSRSPCAWVMS
jgi:hypothetical protein